MQFQTFLGDLVAAFNAVAELTFIETLESRIDLRDFHAPSFYRRLGHSLALKGIHPRQPPLDLLVEFDRGCGFCRVLDRCGQRGLARFEQCAEFFCIDCQGIMPPSCQGLGISPGETENDRGAPQERLFSTTNIVDPVYAATVARRRSR